MTYTLGVDLGTTFSAAAVHRDGTTEIVALAHRSMVVPSAVFVTAEGEVLVGDAALRRGAVEPGRLAREFKRRLGDPIPILVGGAPYPAEALTALLLGQVIAGVTEQQGGPPERTVLTFPANWGPHKQGLLAEAIRLAEVDEGATLTEPEAAAIWYASAERVTPGETVAVYDLGGGTFDAAVLRKTDSGFEVLGTPHGIERLGGIDADEAVFRHVCRLLELDLKTLAADESARRALVRLRTECVDAKEALSADTTATIPVALPDLHRDVRLTRAELETMVRPVLEDTIQALRQTIGSAGLAPDDVDRVLLVGGSSRMPIVADLVTEALGRPFFVDAHPKHVVALGAALAAATPEQAGASPVALPPPTAPEPEEAEPAGSTAEPEARPERQADVEPPAATEPSQPESEPPEPASEHAGSETGVEPEALESADPVATAPAGPDGVVPLVEPLEDAGDIPKAPEREPTDPVGREPEGPEPEGAEARAAEDDSGRTSGGTDPEGSGPEPNGSSASPAPTKAPGASPAPEPPDGPETSPDGETADHEPAVATSDGSGAKGWRWAAIPVAVLLVGLVVMVSRGGGGSDTTAQEPIETTLPPVEGNPGGEVVDLAMFADGVPEHIDPAQTVTFSGAQIVEMLYDGLAGVEMSDPDAPRIVPKVAEAVEVNDDATVWKFTIRDGLEFSDGTPVLPSSFVRGWERATDPDFAMDEAASAFSIVQGAQAKLEGEAERISGLRGDDGAMTLEVRLTGSFPSFDTRVSQPFFMPMPEAADLDDQSTWEDQVMVGNGPFVLEKPRSEDEVVLVPNPRWNGERYTELRLPEDPFLQKVTFRASPDVEAAYQAFEEDGSDVTVAKAPPGEYDEAREKHPNTFGTPLVESYHLQIDWEHETLGGPENRLLRQAISQAINREALNEQMFEGAAQPASGLTPLAVPGVVRGLCDYCTYNRQSAQDAFEAWQDQGNELTDPIEIQSDTVPGVGSPAVASIVADLNEVGITSREEPILSGGPSSQEEYFAQLGDGRCQVCPVGGEAPFYEDFLSAFHTEAGGDKNFGRFSVESFDEGVDDARATPDPDRRSELLQDAERQLLNEETGVIPLLWYAPPSYIAPFVYDDELAGLPQTNLGLVIWELVYFER